MQNESDNVFPLLSGITKVLAKKKYDDYEIIIVNDHSNDNTPHLAKEFSNSKNNRVRLINRYDGKKGVGRTLKAGFKEVKGDLIMTMDGDLSHDPRTIPNFIDEIQQNWDLIIGSRYIRSGTFKMPITRILISRLYNFLSKILLRINISDLTTGFRIFRADLLRKIHLNSDGFEIHPEIHVKIALAGCKYTEIPISYLPREKGVSKLKYWNQGPGYIRVILNAFRGKL